MKKIIFLIGFLITVSCAYAQVPSQFSQLLYQCVQQGDITVTNNKVISILRGIGSLNTANQLIDAKYTDTLGRAIDTRFARDSAIANNSKEFSIKTYQAAGSVVQAQTFGMNINQITTQDSISNDTMLFVPIYIPATTVITGAEFYMGTKGVFIAGSDTSAIGLYSYSGGTLTMVDSTLLDSTIFAANVNTYKKKAFVSTYTATAGLYYVGLLYNCVSQTTAPQLGAGAAVTPLNAAVLTLDFSGGTLVTTTAGASHTKLPHSITATAVQTGNKKPIWCGLY